MLPKTEAELWIAIYLILVTSYTSFKVGQAQSIGYPSMLN